MELKGDFNTAVIYTDEVEQEAISQIYQMINCEAFGNGKIRIMPDVHCGKGSVIGFTMHKDGKTILNCKAPLRKFDVINKVLETDEGTYEVVGNYREFCALEDK